MNEKLLDELIRRERISRVIWVALMMMVSVLIGAVFFNSSSILTNRQVNFKNQRILQTALCTASIPIQEKTQAEIDKCYSPPYTRPGQLEVK